MVVYQSSWTVLQITKSFHFFRYSSKDIKLLRVQIKSHQTHSYCARVRNVVHRTIYTQTVRPGTVRNVTIDKSPWFWFCSQCEYLKGYKFDFLQDHKLWKNIPEKCNRKNIVCKILYFCLINLTFNFFKKNLKVMLCWESMRGDAQDFVLIIDRIISEKACGEGWSFIPW